MVWIFLYIAYVWVKTLTKSSPCLSDTVMDRVDFCGRFLWSFICTMVVKINHQRELIEQGFKRYG